VGYLYAQEGIFFFKVGLEWANLVDEVVVCSWSEGLLYTANKSISGGALAVDRGSHFTSHNQGN
jgi:hypothetical protein